MSGTLLYTQDLVGLHLTVEIRLIYIQCQYNRLTKSWNWHLNHNLITIWYLIEMRDHT